MTLKHFAAQIIADVPAYATIAWLKFATVVSTPDFPFWEQFLFDHGWLILLTMRLVNGYYEWKNNKAIEQAQEVNPTKRPYHRKTWIEKTFIILKKIFIK